MTYYLYANIAFDGQSVRDFTSTSLTNFDTYRNSKDDIEVEEIPYTSFSDYDDSCSVERANHRYLMKMLEENEALQGHMWDLYGSMGSNSMCIEKSWLETSKDAEELRDILRGLENYPAIDDELVSEIEEERKDEAWESWAGDDFKNALSKESLARLYEESDQCNEDSDIGLGELRNVFEEALQWYDIHWKDESSGMWVDVEKVAKLINEGK